MSIETFSSTLPEPLSHPSYLGLISVLPPLKSSEEMKDDYMEIYWSSLSERLRTFDKVK